MKHSNKTILFVDDDPDFRKMLTPWLRALGSTVVEATDGEEGLKRAKELMPDLIITNVKMPIMDGVTMTKMIKEDPKTKNIPVFLLTAFGDPGSEVYEKDVLTAQELGFTDYMVKAFPLEKIVERIKHLLARSDA